jgi:hypothetical protein
MLKARILEFDRMINGLPPFQQNEQGARRDSRRWPPAGYRPGRRLSLIPRFFDRTEIFADRCEQKVK